MCAHTCCVKGMQSTFLYIVYFTTLFVHNYVYDYTCTCMSRYVRTELEITAGHWPFSKQLT